jgi:hypothetical protein
MQRRFGGNQWSQVRFFIMNSLFNFAELIFRLLFFARKNKGRAVFRVDAGHGAHPDPVSEIIFSGRAPARGLVGRAVPSTVRSRFFIIFSGKPSILSSDANSHSH